MRLTGIVAFVAAVLAGSASLAAQQSANLFAPKNRASSAPRFLFPTPTPALNQPRDAGPAQKQPTVVCGLTLIPGDPNVDPAIRHEVPKDGPKFSMRSVDPKVCRRP